MGLIGSIGAALKTAQGDVTAAVTLGGALFAARRYIGGRARLHPAAQGRDWQRFFQAGDLWRPRVRVRSDRRDAGCVRIEFASIATIDYRGRTIVEREDVFVTLEAFPDAGVREELVAIGGAAGGEARDRDVHTVRARGRIRTRSRVGVWLSRGFDFEMREGSAFSGEMFERRRGAEGGEQRHRDRE